MRTRTALVISLVACIFLLVSCTGSVELGPTSTPDPVLMTIEERTIWDFENLRDEVNALAGLAASTPTEDLEPIVRQMFTLTEEIKGVEYPLFAAQAHSALYNFARYKSECCFVKYNVINKEMSDEELALFFGDFDRCERAQVFEETLNLYLQELKGVDAGE